MHDAGPEVADRGLGDDQSGDARGDSDADERREDDEVLDGVGVRLLEPLGPGRLRLGDGRIADCIEQSPLDGAIEDVRHPQQPGESGGVGEVQQFGLHGVSLDS